MILPTGYGATPDPQLAQIIQQRYGLDPTDRDALFNYQYSGRGDNLNPFLSPDVRAQAEAFAQAQGLPSWYAESAAIDELNQHLGVMGILPDEATSPSYWLDDIKRRLLSASGKDWQSQVGSSLMTDAQRQQATQDAIAHQRQIDGADSGGGGLFGGGGFLGLGDLGNALAIGGLALGGAGLAGVGPAAGLFGGAAAGSDALALGSEFGTQGDLAAVLAGSGAGAGAGALPITSAVNGAAGGSMDLGSEFGTQGDLGSVLSGNGSYVSPLYSGGVSSFFSPSDVGGILSKLISNPSLLGAGLGALAGGIGANSKPAGTITNTQDVPDWEKPYVLANLQAGSNALGFANSGNALLPGALNQLSKTINGDYLNPESNPYFKSYANDLMGQAGSQFLGTFGGPAGSNINNSGLQEGFTRAITNATLPLYNSAYNTERNNQLTAATTAPAFSGQFAQSAFAPFTAFSNLFPNLKNTSQPYFTNPAAGALGGAIAGGQLGKAVFG